MAALKDLNDIASKYDPRQKSPQRGQALMQHPRGANEHRVEVSAQSERTSRQSQYAPRSKSMTQRQFTPNVNVTAPDHSEALDHQTQVIRQQGQSVAKQTTLLSQQTGLMHDQVRATKDVSAVVERLYEYMQKEGNKLSPKVQQRAEGNTYEGQFQRVQEKQMLAQEQRQRRREISDDLRRQRSERARGMDRDGRGRFQKRLSPKMQGFGGRMLPGGMMDGIGGRLGGGAARLGAGALGPLLALATAFYGGKAIEAASDNYTYDKHDTNFVSRGWQTAKDKISDGVYRLNGNQTFMDQQPRDQKMINDYTQKANAGDLGSVAGQFESGGRGVMSVSTGKGDKGGVSYGKHQLSSASGTMSNFLRSEEGSKYYNEFRGLTPGSKEFNEKYQDVASRDEKGFGDAQQSFIKKTHFDPLNAWFSKQYDIDTSQRSRALQETLYSISVQYGLDKSKNLIGEALGNRDPSQMSDEEIIRRLQDHRAATVGSFFRSSSKDIQLGVEKRAGDEKAVLLNMLKEENSGTGSVKGSNYVGMGSAMAGSDTFKQAQASFGGKPSMMQGGSGGGGGGGSGNGTVGIMAPGGGSAAGGSGNSDEAGGGSGAGVAFQENGNFFNIGVKNVVPADSGVNIAGLNPAFKKAFFTMVGDWVTNSGGGTVTCTSAFRTRMEQEALWVKYGRNTKRVARPGTSRHESGFAIDIDRKSANSLDQTGMFKKYGFHRPVPNEDWHVEMIGKVGGGGGGAVSKDNAGASPMVMQKAAEQELAKAGDTQVRSAEEGTRQAVQQDVKKEATKADTEVAGASAQADKGATQAAAATDVSNPFAGDVSTTQANGKTDKLDMTHRTPEQQAMYEQYVKSAGGDTRKVPDAITNPSAYGLNATNAEPMKVMAPGGPTPPMVTAGQVALDVNGNPYEAFSVGGKQINTMATPGQGQVALDVNGNPYEAFSVNGKSVNTMASPGMVDNSNPFGPNPNGVPRGAVMGPNGQPQEPGLLDKFGVKPRIYQSGAGVGGGIDGGVLGSVNANQGVHGKGSVYYSPPSASGVMGKLGIPGMNGQVGGIIDGLTRGQKPGKDSMIDMAASAAIGGLFSMAQDRPKPMESNYAPTSTPVYAPTSPASPNYYAQEQPIVSRPMTTAATSVMPVQTSVAPVEAPRQAYNPVQEVSVISAPPSQSSNSGPSGPAAGSGAGGKVASSNNDMPQLDEIPAMLDDVGLMLIGLGY